MDQKFGMLFVVDDQGWHAGFSEHHPPEQRRSSSGLRPVHVNLFYAISIHPVTFPPLLMNILIYIHISIIFVT